MKKLINPKENEISHLFHKDSDLAQREEEMLKDAATRLDFKPSKIIMRSGWWDSKKIGAFHYRGTYQGRSAVLKIQGVKPETSEIYMITSFDKANKSKAIRPPYVYGSIPWDKKKSYEALVLEDVGDKKIVNLPATRVEIDRFFQLYKDYRANCRLNPWVEKYNLPISERIKHNFKQWRRASRQIYPNHPLRKAEDEELINTAVGILGKAYEGVELEFQHAHFGDGDLYQVGDEVILLSNLYWSWRPPFYDTVFGYHWYRYHLGGVEGVTQRQINRQINIWLSRIRQYAKSQVQRRLLNLALLERATAGLNIDALSLDPEKPNSVFLVEDTRKSISDLILIIQKS